MSKAGPRRMHQLLEAVVAIGSGLDLPTTLYRITELAAELVDARYAALGVLDSSRSVLAQFITVGIDDETKARIGALPSGHGVLGVLIEDASPIRLPDLNEHPDRYGFPPNHPPMRSFLGVPIVVRDEVYGNLYLTDKTSAEVFSDVDEELVVGLAAAAGVAIENARLHERVNEMTLFEDRERIARDLHDTVIQRLFATGMSLQGTGPLVANDPTLAVTRINAAVDDLDETVKRIRTSIFALEATTPARHSVRDGVLALCREAVGAMGFEPRVLFDGAVDAAVSDAVAIDLLATLREALSNVAQHARATQVDVVVRVTDGTVALSVVDDGVGLSANDESPGHGLKNMLVRAQQHDGVFEISAGSPTGTVAVWTVPISP